MSKRLILMIAESGPEGVTYSDVTNRVTVPGRYSDGKIEINLDVSDLDPPITVGDFELNWYPAGVKDDT